MTFKDRTLRILTVLLAVLLSAFGTASAREVITEFDVSVQINGDSSITVTEDITVNVENIEINRGIQRLFPVRYKDKDGREVRVGFKVREVNLDGTPIKWSTSDAGRAVKVRIGDPNSIITRGLHTFTIVYDTTRQLGFYEDFDELYWNATGNDWTFPILSASCRVALPGRNFGDGFRSIEWYVGSYGSKGVESDARMTRDGTVTTDRPLGVGEGLTVVYTWPKGIVAPPPPPKKDSTAVQGAIGVATLLSVGTYLFKTWKKWGKDPVKKAVIPLFRPPKDSTAAYLRYARSLKTDQTGFGAAIIELAVKGALKIVEEEGRKVLFIKGKNRMSLEKCPKPKEPLQPEEEALLERLFPDGTERLVISKDSHDRLVSSMNSLRGHLSLKGASLYTGNASKMLPAAVIYAIGTLLLYPFGGDTPYTFLAALLAGVILIAIGMRGSKPTVKKSESITVFLGRLAMPVIAGLGIVIALEDFNVSPVPALIFVAAAGLIAVMRPLMARRTEKGTDLLAETEGLILYMQIAEKDRLEMLNAPEDTPELYERLLPYAMALDVAKTWGNRFENVLKEAQYEPDWYVGPNPLLFNSAAGFNALSSNLMNNISSGIQIEAPESAPGSFSGSGGGGFSGGGGGGGGGSGW